MPENKKLAERAWAMQASRGAQFHMSLAYLRTRSPGMGLEVDPVGKMFGELKLFSSADPHWNYDPVLDAHRRQARLVRKALNSVQGLLPEGVKIVEVTPRGVSALSLNTRVMDRSSAQKIRALLDEHPIERIVLKFPGNVLLHHIARHRVLRDVLRAFPNVTRLGICADGSVSAEFPPRGTGFPQVTDLMVRAQRFNGRQLRRHFPSLTGLGIGEGCKVPNTTFVDMCGDGWPQLRSLRLPMLSSPGSRHLRGNIETRHETVFSHSLIDGVPNLVELAANFMPGSLIAFARYGRLSALERLVILQDSVPTREDLKCLGKVAPHLRELKNWATLKIASKKATDFEPLARLEGVVCDADISPSAMAMFGVLVRNAKRIMTRAVDPLDWAERVTKFGMFNQLGTLCFRLSSGEPINTPAVRELVSAVFPATRIQFTPDSTRGDPVETAAIVP